jgi:cobalamin synthase
MDLSNSYELFKKAWNLLSFFKLPETDGEKKEEIDEIPDNIVVYFPAVGAAIGFSAYCVAWFLERIMDGKIFAAMLSAVIITLTLEILTLGKDLSTLMNFLKATAKKLPPDEALALIEEKDTVNSGISELVLLFSLFILKIICIGILIYSQKASWLIVILTLSYLVQGLLAISRSSNLEAPLLPSEQDTAKSAWIIAAIISLIAGIEYIPAVVLALIISWFSFDGFQKYWLSRFRTITGKSVGLGGIILEYLLLVGGTILLARQ